MIKLLKQAIYRLVKECTDELKEMQHIENDVSLYKEDDD